MGKIILEGMEFRAPVGVMEKEKLFGSRLIVNVAISGAVISGKSDHLSETIDYAVIYAIVKRCVMQPANLMEYVAQNIIDEIAATYINNLETIHIAIRKMNPPLDGVVEASGVEMEWNAPMH